MVALVGTLKYAPGVENHKVTNILWSNQLVWNHNNHNQCSSIVLYLHAFFLKRGQLPLSWSHACIFCTKKGSHFTWLPSAVLWPDAIVTWRLRVIDHCSYIWMCNINITILYKIQNQHPDILGLNSLFPYNYKNNPINNFSLVLKHLMINLPVNTAINCLVLLRGIPTILCFMAYGIFFRTWQ